MRKSCEGKSRLIVPIIQGVDGRTKDSLSRYGCRIPLLHRKYLFRCGNGVNFMEVFFMFEVFDTKMDGIKAGIRSFLEPTQQFFSVFSNPWISFGFVVLVFVLCMTVCVCRGYSFRRYIKQSGVLAICALMIALNIVLGYFTIRFSTYLRVSFGFITQPVITILFGPLVGCATGIIQDILSYFLVPGNASGPLIPAYTLCVGIAGMIYGMMLYQKPVTLWRVFLTKLIITLVANIILNSVALAPTVGSGFVGILPARILKNLILLPIQTIVVYFMLRFMKRVKVFHSFEREERERRV